MAHKTPNLKMLTRNTASDISFTTIQPAPFPADGQNRFYRPAPHLPEKKARTTFPGFFL